MDPNYPYSYGYTDPYYSSSSYGHDHYSVYNQPASSETPNPNYSYPFASYQTYDGYHNSGYSYNGSSYCTTDDDNQSISTHATTGSEPDLLGVLNDVSYVNSLRPTSSTCFEPQVADYGNPAHSETTIKLCFEDGPVTSREIKEYYRGRYGRAYMKKITKLDDFHAKIVLKDASLLQSDYQETHYINGKKVLARKTRN